MVMRQVGEECERHLFYEALRHEGKGKSTTAATIAEKVLSPCRLPILSGLRDGVKRPPVTRFRPLFVSLSRVAAANSGNGGRTAG
jgi:hypothetical protein